MEADDRIRESYLERGDSNANKQTELYILLVMIFTELRSNARLNKDEFNLTQKFIFFRSVFLAYQNFRSEDAGWL